MTPNQIARVRTSFELAKPNAPQLVEAFYDELFRANPELRSMFPTDMADQQRKLTQVLAVAISMLDDMPRLEPVLHDMGGRHVGYGVKNEHYAQVGAALLTALEAGLGDAWTIEVAAAWQAAFMALAGEMLVGAARAEALVA